MFMILKKVEDIFPEKGDKQVDSNILNKSSYCPISKIWHSTRKMLRHGRPTVSPEFPNTYLINQIILG